MTPSLFLLALLAAPPSSCVGEKCEIAQVVEAAARLGLPTPPDPFDREHYREQVRVYTAWVNEHLDEINLYLIPEPGQRQFADYDCGLGMLLAKLDYLHWAGGDPDPAYFKKKVGTNARQGTPIKDIVQEATRLKIPHQLHPEVRTLEDLEKILYGGKTWKEVRAEGLARVELFKQGKLALSELFRAPWLLAAHPVGVLLQAYMTPGRENVPPEHDWEDGHFEGVKGMDCEKPEGSQTYLGNVYFMDPSMNGKTAYIPCEEFLARWHDESDTSPPGKYAQGYNHLAIEFDLPAGLSLPDLNIATYWQADYSYLRDPSDKYYDPR